MVQKANERYAEIFRQLALIDERAADARAMGTSREYPFPIFRAMVWQRMRDEGYSTTYIAQAAERVHGTIVRVTNNLQGMLVAMDENTNTLRRDWRKLNAVLNSAISKEEPFCEEKVQEVLEMALSCGRITDGAFRWITKELGL